MPAGQSDGGQWTSGGGDGDLPRVAQGRLRGRPPFRGKPPSAAPGPTIRNKDLAGKNHPDTGIPFDKEGFPDFSGVATKTVRVPHTGDRTADFRAANRGAGLPDTPPGMTWHHHQDGQTMQLVPLDVHRRMGHTRSIGIGNMPGKK
ncbi:MAG TPA: HNH endonuclease [Hyphomicrobiaceae bacterium]|nr:HNH endonuclease [Hyphomicrobiaceae bacterium]